MLNQLIIVQSSYLLFNNDEYSIYIKLVYIEYSSLLNNKYDDKKIKIKKNIKNKNKILELLINKIKSIGVSVSVKYRPISSIGVSVSVKYWVSVSAKKMVSVHP